MASFERGFKSWAERTSLGLRRELGLGLSSPLAYGQLAEHLGVELLTLRQIPGLPDSVRHQLDEEDPWGWSAVGFETGERTFVIYNERHSTPRQASNVTHELAHFMLGHETGTIILSPDGLLAMRSYNQKQENEADWLAGCLLLPRPALLRMAKMAIPEIAEQFGVSQRLASYRINITGVRLQSLRTARREVE